MGTLNLNDLKEAMVLAADIKNKHGNILIKEGSTLTVKHILLMKAWGVTEADVVGFDKDQVEKEEMHALSPEIIEAIEKELRAVFPPFDNNPIMAEIYRIARKLKLRQASSNSGEAAS